MTLNIGDKAPEFVLPTENDIPLSLTQFRGKKVVLFFYPKDNTPGCTKEACDFRDYSSEFEKLNTVVLGISRDNAKSHARFKTKYALPFTLLVDSLGEVCTAYGVINKKSLFGHTFLGIERSTFLIDEEGMISAIWRKVKVKNHVEQVLNELK